MNKERGFSVAVSIWIFVGVLAATAISIHLYDCYRSRPVAFTTPYQAVLLTNGSVYFGRLQDYGTAHPVLTDVYYVVSQSNPETKQVTNSLIKRGKELHEPDRMYLNPSQIVFVESVGPNSKVAQLIAEQKKQ